MVIRNRIRQVAAMPIDAIGFTDPTQREQGAKRRDPAVAGLITTAALVVSLAIALTAVSFGIARADVVGAITAISSTGQ